MLYPFCCHLWIQLLSRHPLNRLSFHHRSSCHPRPRPCPLLLEHHPFLRFPEPAPFGHLIRELLILARFQLPAPTRISPSLLASLPPLYARRDAICHRSADIEANRWSRRYSSSSRTYCRAKDCSTTDLNNDISSLH